MERKNSINKEHSKGHNKEQFKQLNKKLTLFNDADLKNRKVKSAPEIGGRSSSAFSGKTAVKKTGPGKEIKKIAVLVTNGSIKHYSRVWKNVKNVPGFSSDAFIAAADGGSIHCINFRIARPYYRRYGQHYKIHGRKAQLCRAGKGYRIYKLQPE